MCSLYFRNRRPGRGTSLSAALCVLLTSLAGCGDNREQSQYFPLRDGMQWIYRVDRTTMDGHRELRHVIGTASGSSDQPALGARTSLNGSIYRYRSTEQGIVREAIEGASFVDPRFPAFPDKLVLPRELAPGVSWQTPGRTSVLENTGPPWETLFRITVPLELTYTVISTDAEVDTPLGTFSDCLLVEGTATATAEVGNYIGRAEISVLTQEWYAPGVGLVSLHRTERTDATALNAGELRLELIDWQD